MSKQWIYRNGDKPFSVTEIVMLNGEVQYVSVSNANTLRCHFTNGSEFNGCHSSHDLITYEPYSDFKIDDECYFMDSENNAMPILCGHWAGLDEHGKPTAFGEGKTSFTSNGSRKSFNFSKKARPTTEDK
jgi:hypothetical protein